MASLEQQMNYIDATKFDLVSNDIHKDFSMTKMREILDTYESTDLRKGVHGIWVTENQYYAYERKIYDGMMLLGVPEGTPIPEKLTFNGIPLVITPPINGNGNLTKETEETKID